MTGQDPCSNTRDRDGTIDLGPTLELERSDHSEQGLDLRLRIALAEQPSATQLIEWLCADQIRGWQDGRRIPAEAYLSLHPTLEAEENAAFEVVYSEFMLREDLGESPCVEEFAWRFPRLAERLRRQVAFHRELTRVEENDGQGAGSPAVRPTEQDDASGFPELAGAPEIPGYRILGELGRGGAGVVYKARQLALNRLVALKVIPSGHHALPGAVERFRAEAEAVARFQHPNIIQVYEVGEYEGLGYLSLEYAAGGSLERAIAGTPREPAAAAALLETLARAMHYAHQSGIVHRDLKPANIVMSEGGVPKITDFGLAKLLEQEAGATVSGTIVGTPSYMAPEQLLGPSSVITPAADVYALGAILYEILTGRPPFKGATPLSTLDQVAHQDPLFPSKLQRSTPPDLETICMKCLEKDPARRYRTAEELADELGRYQEGRPILARPAPLWEKAAKWALRHPGLASALAGVALAVLAVFVAILYYNGQLRASVGAARHAKEESDRSAMLAVKQRDLALGALNQLVYEVQEGLGETPQTRTLRQSLLDTAITGLDQIAASNESTPPDKSRAVAHQRLGEIYRLIGSETAAARQLGHAARLGEQLAKADPWDLDIKECLSRVHIGQGEIDLVGKHNEIALDHFHRVVELCEEIMRADPRRPGARRGLLEAYIRLGRAQDFHLDFDEALAVFQRARDLAEQWSTEEPDNPQPLEMLAWSYRKIGDVDKHMQKFDAARADYAKAIAVGRGSLKSHPDDRETKRHLATALNDLGAVLLHLRDLPGSRPLCAESETLFAELVAADPDQAETRSFLVHATYDHARVLRALGRFSEAASAYRRTIESLSRLPGERLASHSAAEFLQLDILRKALAECESAAGASGSQRKQNVPTQAK
jgi:tetratricopeptide (TPR) repeat protein